MTPTGTPKVVRSTSYHWRTRSSVGATTSVLRRRSSIARHATYVLPAPVGKHDDAAVAPRLPRRQRLGLVGARLAADQRAPLQLRVAARPVVDGDGALAGAGGQRAPQVGVRGGRRAEARRARVPQAAGELRRVGGQAAQLEGSADERQRQRRRGHPSLPKRNRNAWIVCSAAPSTPSVPALTTRS